MSLNERTGKFQRPVTDIQCTPQRLLAVARNDRRRRGFGATAAVRESRWRRQIRRDPPFANDGGIPADREHAQRVCLCLLALVLTHRHRKRRAERFLAGHSVGSRSGRLLNRQLQRFTDACWKCWQGMQQRRYVWSHSTGGDRRGGNRVISYDALVALFAIVQCRDARGDMSCWKRALIGSAGDIVRQLLASHPHGGREVAYCHPDTETATNG